MTLPVAVSLLVLAVAPFHSSIQPLPGLVRAEVKRDAWHSGCTVPLSDLRLLTVSYRGFDGRTYTGQLVVNRSASVPLALVFRQLYRLHFPIRPTSDPVSVASAAVFHGAQCGLSPMVSSQARHSLRACPLGLHGAREQ